MSGIRSGKFHAKDLELVRATRFKCVCCGHEKQTAPRSFAPQHCGAFMVPIPRESN